MIQKTFFILAFISISIAWLFPNDATSWVSFISEYLAFIAAFFIVAGCFHKDKIQIPQIILPILLISFIPFMQFFLGTVFSVSIAYLSFFYLFVFFALIVYSYNLTKDQQPIIWLSYALVFSSITSCVFAISQWLDIYIYVPVIELKGNRPYANFGQPNHLSTFLFMGFLAALYLLEVEKLKKYLAYTFIIIILFTIALTQSRTSWIVIAFIVIFYLVKKLNSDLKLKPLFMASCSGFLLLCIILQPKLSVLIRDSFGFNTAQTMEVLTRATTQHERIELWKQAFDLIFQKPFSGYGWNQTGISVVEQIERVNFSYWYSSTHNIILDIFTWCGLILGSLIVLYFTYLILYSTFKIKIKEANYALLMIGVVLIHGMLEYPLSYSYFLLPVGFLLGIVLSGIKDLKIISVSNKFTYLVIVIYAGCLYLVWTEYVNALADQSKAKIIALNRMAKIEDPKDKYFEIENNYYILKDMGYHAEWLALNAKQKYSLGEIEKMDKFVTLYPSQFNLIKLAQIYLYNDHKIAAERQLYVFNKLYKSKYTMKNLEDTLNK